MAQLFWTGTIKSHIDPLQGFDESKISLIQKLHEDWKKWHLTWESEYEQTFNQLFFGELLWYEDRTNRIPKWAVSWTWIADLTLWFFEEGKYDPDHVQVVCELKWAKTNLTKKQFWHGGLSPVGQGFSYKTGLKNCKRLVVSNFYEIRLYRDNQTDFEVWNLDELMDPKDNYFNLRKLYLLLHKSNLLSTVAMSRTEKLLSHFREKQQEITKDFYKEYKWLRIELINDIKDKNPWISSETIIEKAQKIIDRLIFIFFCEDRGLLPDKKIKEYLYKGKELDMTSWESLKKFFQGVDQWSENLGIPDGFNGGLFKQDESLNALSVGDHICKKLIDLTNFDFDDKLSVNVLGHIFEQSISDLENLKIDLLGQEVETEQLADTGKGRRKKDGIFYTPEYIVDYIVQNSVMKYLNEKEDECLSEVSTIDEKTGERRRKKNIDNAEQKAYLKYQQVLQNIKVLDPACGSGAFLVRVFDVLFEENKRVWSILNSLFDETETYKNILTNNIYGVDLNAESVEITKLSLRLKSAQKGKKLNNLDGNIKCGNSLIDDVFVAKEKAFDWKREFPKIFWSTGMTLPATLWSKKETGFDVVVWNPPYIFSRGWKFSTSEKEYYYTHYKISDYQINTYVLFLERSFTLLKNSGCLWFIVPNTWLTISSFAGLRKFILQNTGDISILNIYDKVFSDANVDTCILNFSKNNDDLITLWEISEQIINTFGSFQKKSFDNDSAVINISSIKNPLINKLIEKIEKNSSKLNSIATVSTGVKVYQIGKGKPIQTSETKDSRVFHSMNQIDATYVKYLEGKDVNRYFLGRSWEYVSYWDWIAEPRKSIDFSAKRILVRQIPSQPPYCINAILTDEYFINDINSMVIIEMKINPDYLLAIINSKLISYWFQNKFDKLQRWLFPQFKVKELGIFPIKIASDNDSQSLIFKTTEIINTNKKFYEIKNKFLHRIQDNLKIEKLTKKLENFYEWDFKDFLAELKKQKVSLSLAQQDEWEPYFKEYKEKILALKGEIAKVDGEIDEMVYKLYGLTDEEVNVIEGK